MGILTQTHNGLNFVDSQTYIQYNGTTILTILSGGNVGIGTSSPGSKLEVVAPNNTVGFKLLNADGNSTAAIRNAGTPSRGELYLDNNGTNQVFITANGNSHFNGGNVGIGTTSPTQKLHVVGTGMFTDFVRFNGVTAPDFPVDIDSVDGGKALRSTRGTSIFRIDQSNDGPGYIGMQSDDDLSIQTNNTSRIYITSAGNVGIGTTSPVSQLDITKTFNARAGNQSNPTGGASIAIDYQTSSDIQGRIRVRDWDAATWKNFTVEANNIILSPFSNVGIGTTSPSYRLHILDSVSNGRAIQAIQSATSGTNYGAVFAAEGSGATKNVGLYANATGATTNYAAIFDNGNVGIGTTSPGGPLEIYKANSGGLGGHLILNNNGLAEANETAIMFNDSGVGATNSVRAAISSTVEGSPYYGDLKFKTGAGAYGDLYTRMIIKGNGNVGIGRTDPAYKLDVVGNTRSDNVMIGADVTYGGTYRSLSFGYNGDGSNRIFATHDSADGMYFAAATGQGFNFRPNGGTANLVVINSAGNVGIGTTSPLDKLHIVSSTANNLISKLEQDNASYQAWWQAESQDGKYINIGVSNNADNYSYLNTSKGTLRFLMNSSPKMTINSSGNVGIGTTSPAQKLHVVGNVRIDDGYTLSWGADTTKIAGNSSSNTLSLKTNSTDRLYIDSVGSVGIGTTSPAYKLDVDGTGRFNGNIALITDASSGNYSLIQHNYGGSAKAFSGYNSGFAVYGGESGVDTRLQAGGQYGLSIKNDTLNVGIGTTSPGYKLDVNGTVRFADTLTLDKASTTYGAAALYIAGLNSYFDWNDGLVFRGEGSLWSARFTGTSNMSATGQILGVYKEETTPGSLGDVIATFNNDGNVGIGTTSPDTLLHIESTSSGTSPIFTVENDNDIKLKLGAVRSLAGTAPDTTFIAYDSSLRFIADADSTTEVARITSGGNVGIGTTNPTTKLYVDAGESTFNRGNSDGAIARFRGKNAEQAVIGTVDSWFDSNVGIGTTSPLSPLHQVAGGVDYTGEARFGGSSTAFGVELKYTQAGSTSGSIYVSPTYSSTDILFKLGAGLGNENQLVLKGNGNVGIGTTSPDVKLHVKGTWVSNKGILAIDADSGTRYSGLTMQNNGAAYGFLSHDNTDSYIDLYATSATGLRFSTADTTRMVINSSGNVGIGTTSPTAKLDVNGFAVFNADINVQDAIAIYNYSPANGNSAASSLTFRGQGQTGGVTRSAFWRWQIEPDSAYGNSGFSISKNYDGGGYNEYIRINSSGNVGIGTTSPYSNVTLQYTGNNSAGTYFGNLVLNATTANTWNRLRFDRNGVARFGVSLSYQDKFVISNLYTNGTTADPDDSAFVILQNSNVGIGTTSPAYKLDIGNNTSETVRISAAATSGNTANLLFGSNTIVSQAARIQGIYGGSWDGALAFSTQDAGAADGNRMTEKVRITSAGNVGIGTNTPDAKLHAKASGNSTYIFRGMSSAGTDLGGFSQGSTGDAEIYLKTSAVVTNVKLSTNGSSYLNGGNVGIGTTSPNLKLHLSHSDSNNGLLLQNTNNVNNYQILQNIRENEGLIWQRWINGVFNSNLMTLSYDGNVGIGTTSPGRTLDVAGSLRINEGNNFTDFDIKSDRSSGNIGGVNFVNASDVIKGQVYGHTDGSVKIASGGTSVAMTILDGGNVGIGTTSPGYKLDISSADNSQLRISATDSNPTTLVLDTTTAATDRIRLKNDAGAFKVAVQNTSDVLTITTAGNVGIGTTSPDHSLQIERSTGDHLKLSRSGVGSFELGVVSSNALKFSDGGTERMRITSAGNLLIGTNTDNGKKLQVQGDVFIKGSASTSGTKIFEVQNSNGTSIMDFRGDAYAFFGCGQGGGAASGFIFRYNDTAAVQFTGYNYGNGSGAYKPILMDTDLVGRSQGVYVNFGATGYANPAPTSDTEFAVRGRTADSSEYAAKFRDSNNTDVFAIRNDGQLETKGSTGYTGTINFPTNAIGSQNLEFKNGLLVNVS